MAKNPANDPLEYGIQTGITPTLQHAQTARSKAQSTAENDRTEPVKKPDNKNSNSDKQQPQDTGIGIGALAMLDMLNKTQADNAAENDFVEAGYYHIPEDFEVQDGVSTVINGQTVTASNFYSHSSYSGGFGGGNFNADGFIPKLGKLSNIHADGSFQQAFGIVVASEGGFANHKADRGGATIFGIASKANPSEYQEVMSMLRSGDKQGAMNRTMQVYHDKYWKVAGIDRLQDPEARLVAFDAAINHGAGYAKKMISRLGDDAEGMLRYRANTYIQIVNNDPSQQVFMKGWQNRLAKLDSIVDNDAAPSVQMASSVYKPEKGSALAKTFNAADKIELPAHVPTPAPKQHQEQGVLASATSFVSNKWKEWAPSLGLG